MCRTCAETQNTSSACGHDETQRSMTGTWVLCEIKMALKYGYKILDKIEIWEYNMEQYDPKTKTGGLSTDYMKTFLKIKQEASGWPAKCNTPEQRLDYITSYEELEGIKLDVEKIEVNPTYRSLAKLCANSLWCKLCQREDNSQTSIITSPHILYQMFISPAVTVSDLCVTVESVCVN